MINFGNIFRYQFWVAGFFWTVTLWLIKLNAATSIRRHMVPINMACRKVTSHLIKFSSGHPSDWVYLNSALFVFVCRHIWEQWDLPLHLLLFCWAPGGKCWLPRATPKHQPQQPHQQPTATRLYLFLTWLWRTWCCPFDHTVDRN